MYKLPTSFIISFAHFSRYVYRIAVARSQEIYEAMRTEPSTVCFSERDYAWFLPPGLDLYKVQKACELFHGSFLILSKKVI